MFPYNENLLHLCYSELKGMKVKAFNGEELFPVCFILSSANAVFTLDYKNNFKLSIKNHFPSSHHACKLGFEIMEMFSRP